MQSNFYRESSFSSYIEKLIKTQKKIHQFPVYIFNIQIPFLKSEIAKFSEKQRLWCSKNVYDTLILFKNFYNNNWDAVSGQAKYFSIRENILKSIFFEKLYHGNIENKNEINIFGRNKNIEWKETTLSGISYTLQINNINSIFKRISDCSTIINTPKPRIIRTLESDSLLRNYFENHERNKYQEKYFF